MRESARFSVVVTVAYAAAFWVVAMVFPGALIRIFNSEPEVVAAGIPALRIYFSMFVFMSLHMAGQGVFVSWGGPGRPFSSPCCARPSSTPR